MGYILFDSTKPVKSKANRNRRPFGSGILAWSPTYKAAYSQEDYAAYLEWLAELDREECQARKQAERDYNAHLEERAEMAEMMDRVCAGAAM